MVVFWLILYGAIFRVKSAVYRAICCCVYVGALFLCLKRSGKVSNYPLTLPGKSSIVRYSPLLALCVCNAVGIAAGESCMPDIYSIIITVFVSFAEEMFFRGFLTRLFSFKYGVVAVNVLFALSHLLSPSAHPLLLLLRCMYAFSTGMCLSLIAKRERSLFCPIIIHTLINLTALPILHESGLLAAICAAVSYTCLLFLRSRRTTKF